MNKRHLLTLLNRGDYIAIENGRLIIKPASGSTVPKRWMDLNRLALSIVIAQQAGITAFSYQIYKTGRFGNGYPGVSLQLLNLVSDTEAFCIFNCELTRARTTTFGKKGDSLPKGQFRVTKRSNFYNFWKSTNLYHRDNSSFHSHMSSLKDLVLTGEPAQQDGKVKSPSLAPVCISHNQIKTAFHLFNSTGNLQGNRGELTGNSQGKVTGKESYHNQLSPITQPESTTCDFNYDKRLKGSEVIPATIPVINKGIRPETQSTDEWLHYHKIALSNY